MKYRLNGGYLEWWDETISSLTGQPWGWVKVACQNGQGDCQRGCSAFEETTADKLETWVSVSEYTKQSAVVRLSCGCGRTIKLEEGE